MENSYLSHYLRNTWKFWLPDIPGNADIVQNQKTPSFQFQFKNNSGGGVGLVDKLCPTLATTCTVLPGSSVHGILQARLLSASPFPSLGDLPDPRIKLTSPALQADSLPLRNQGSRINNSKRERWELSLHGYRVPVLQDDILENCCTIIWIYLTTGLYIMAEVVHF